MKRQPVTTEHLQKLTNPADRAREFATAQPNLAVALLQKYGYLPMTAYMSYAVLTDVMGSVPTASAGAAEAILSQIAANRKEMTEQFVHEQPRFAELLEQAYGYVPAPGLAVYFGLFQDSIDMTSFEQQFQTQVAEPKADEQPE